MKKLEGLHLTHWISMVRNQEIQRTHIYCYLSQKSSGWTRTFFRPLFRTIKELRSWPSETVESYPGYNIYFYPKFHCELNFISYIVVWGWAKSHHRTHCKFTYNDHKTELPVTLDEKLPIAYVRRAFDHCLWFLNGYHVGLKGAVLEYAVKKHKSHRRFSPSIDLFIIEEGYLKKKKSQMTYKRCK